MFLYNGEQLEGHAAGMLGTRFPLFDSRFAGVKVARENRLTDVVGLS